MVHIIKINNFLKFYNNYFKGNSPIIFKEEKMLSIVKSMALHGLNGYLVNVQVDVSSRTSIMGSSSDFQIQV